ncbi:MOSC domain-containing protein [uncultured Roseobacter sp.]|uniref:MOSC domain-containing protein n=1 Tax=uncultured Roseobacter sp. TaxID=114847 RepID=UPI00261BA191|nr:MOSC domain-containing protein [uncultured Roseobacter sp.]
MTAASLTSRINGLFVGQIQNRWEGREPSAIGKTAVTSPMLIDENGFVEDAQADLKNHGGCDKAIHHYASDHYASWIAEGEIPVGTIPAAFGENVATSGMTEDMLCVGDILRFGTAVVQISQGRQPCWKVSEHTRNSRMAYLFQKTGRTGWYYRVLENGRVAVGNEVQLIERRQPDWSVRRVTAARLTRRISEEDAAELAMVPELAEGWRVAFSRMASGDRTEDTSRRLEG